MTPAGTAVAVTDEKRRNVALGAHLRTEGETSPSYGAYLPVCYSETDAHFP